MVIFDDASAAGCWNRVSRGAAQVFERSTDFIVKLAFLLLVLALAPILVTESRALLAMVGNGTVLAMTLVSIFGLAAGHILGGPDFWITVERSR